jgi:L-lactate utilization protein LutB
LNYGKFATIPSDDVIARTKAGLEKNGFVVHVVHNRAEALAAIQKLIAEHPGASVMNGASTVRIPSTLRPQRR